MFFVINFKCKLNIYKKITVTITYRSIILLEKHI